MEQGRTAPSACRREEQAVLGAEHPFTDNQRGQPGVSVPDQGRWKEAKELEAQMIEISKRVLGAENPIMLCDKNNLAPPGKLS